MAETPLPLLLHAIATEEWSGLLELKGRGVEKRISVEDGSPVTCASNLLHETLGRYLVDHGKLTDEQHQHAFAESARTGQKMGEVLVQKGWLAPFELYKQLQANMAHKILDCFRWGEGRYRLVPDAPKSDVPVKMNPLQLVLTGVMCFLPFEALAAHFAFSDEQKFALVPKPPHALDDLKLGAKETRALQALRARPVFSELVSKTGAEMEEALRRLYALCVLGFVDFAEAVEVPAPAPEPAPASPSMKPVPRGVEGLGVNGDENALMAAFLEHRQKDPFDLLGVHETAAPAMLRRAFLDRADKLSPTRFSSPDLKEKAEALLIAYARAYTVLADPEQLALWKRRRAASEEAKSEQRSRPSTEEQFRIKTDLLDSRSQIAEGKKRLAAKNYAGALEQFQFACDIDRKPQHLAYLGWARYLLNPEAHAKLALQELYEAQKQADPPCEEAYAFAAEIHKALGELDRAEECYRRAYKANPAEKRYAAEIQALVKRKKTG